MQPIDTPHYFEKVKDKQVYKINKHQYLKINKSGNGEIIAPAKDPITKKWNTHNLICTGGTIWGTIKVILIVAFLLFLLWRYNVEIKDCLEIRANFNKETGCINKAYFTKNNLRIGEVDNEQIRLSLPSLTEGNDKPLS